VSPKRKPHSRTKTATATANATATVTAAAETTHIYMLSSNPIQTQRC
jgi:hypothetical protein